MLSVMHAKSHNWNSQVLNVALPSANSSSAE